MCKTDDESTGNKKEELERQPDLVIYYGHQMNYNSNPNNNLNQVCLNIVNTISQDGTVLLPMQSIGLMLELLEHIFRYLEHHKRSSTPIYLVRPKAREILASSQIYAEWLSPQRAEQAYIPEKPFAHSDYIANEKLIPLEEISAFTHKENFGDAAINFSERFCSVRNGDEHLHSGLGNKIRKPCIIISTFPSLRIGDACKILDMLCQPDSSTVTNPNSNVRNKNLVIFPEFDINVSYAMEPWRTTNIKFDHLPIDTRFNLSSAVDLLTLSLNPTRIITNRYTKDTILKSFDDPQQINILQKFLNRESQGASADYKFFNANQVKDSLSKKLLSSKPNEIHTFPARSESNSIIKVKLSEHLLKKVRFAETGQPSSWVSGFQAVITKRNGTYTVDLPLTDEADVSGSSQGTTGKNPENSKSSASASTDNQYRFTKSWPVIKPDVETTLKKLGQLNLIKSQPKIIEESSNRIAIEIESAIILEFKEHMTNLTLKKRDPESMILKKKILRCLLEVTSI